MLNVFRRAPTRSPHREVGGRPFLRELRDQRENTPPSSPPSASSQYGGYDSETRVNWVHTRILAKQPKRKIQKKQQVVSGWKENEKCCSFWNFLLLVFASCLTSGQTPAVNCTVTLIKTQPLRTAVSVSTNGGLWGPRLLIPTPRGDMMSNEGAQRWSPPPFPSLVWYLPESLSGLNFLFPTESRCVPKFMTRSGTFTLIALLQVKMEQLGVGWGHHLFQGDSTLCESSCFNLSRRLMDLIMC